MLLHLRGQLVNGGCAVATESEDLRTDGTVPARMRLPVGSFAPVSNSIFVTVNLLLARRSGVMSALRFAGVTPAEDPHVFW